MFTLDKSPATKVTYTQDGIIALNFQTDETLTEGTQVKLLSTGKVASLAAVTDMPIGVVAAVNPYNKGGVTVHTGFTIVTKGQADGILAIGDKVSISDYDVATFLDDYKASVTTNYVVGICLVAAADNAETKIGVIRTPFLI